MARIRHIAAPLVGAMLLPALSHAQVTVFGVVDAAARHVSNSGVGSVKSLVSGSNQTSRIGFRGTEDLGGGLSAGFHLESGIALDTGVGGASAPAGQFWDRRATVSLASKGLGELRLGRDFVPTYTTWSRHDPFGYVGSASSSNLISASPTGAIRAAFGTSPNVLVRSNNAVQLLLPAGVVGPVDGGLMIAAGEGGTAANGQYKLSGARVGFAAGALYATAGTLSAEHSLSAGTKFKDNVVGVSYDFGVAKLSGAWRQFKFGTAKQTNLLLGGTVPLGTGEVRVSYQRADMDGTVGATNVSANDATQLGLGYVHSLSKRTAAYATVARVSNKGAATFVTPGGPSGMAGGGTSTGVEMGLRHSF